MFTIGNMPNIKMPSSIGIEMAIIGAILKRPGVLDALPHAIPLKAFFDPECREIFSVITREANKGSEIDHNVIMSFLSAEERKMANKCLEMAKPEGMVTYFKYLMDFYLRREIVASSVDAVSLAQDQNVEASLVLSQTQERLDLMNFKGEGNEAEGFHPIAQRVFFAGCDVADSGLPKGLRTGIRNLDNILLPIRPGSFVIIAARPAQGKTALLINVLEYIATASLNGEAWAGPTAIISLEMSKEDLVERMLAGAMGVPSSSIAAGEFARTRDEEKLQDFIASRVKLPLHICKPETLTANNLFTVCNRLVRKYKVKAIGIDYIQLMDGDDTKSSNDRIGKISKACKRVADRLGIVIFGLSQLSRKIEEREDKTPLPSDLRESGSLEQDADVIVMIYWKKPYILAKEPPPTSPSHTQWAMELSEAGDTAALTVVKQRRGRTGKAFVRFDEVRTKFI